MMVGRAGYALVRASRPLAKYAYGRTRMNMGGARMAATALRTTYRLGRAAYRAYSKRKGVSRGMPQRKFRRMADRKESHVEFNRQTDIKRTRTNANWTAVGTSGTSMSYELTKLPVVDSNGTGRTINNVPMVGVKLCHMVSNVGDEAFCYHLVVLRTIRCATLDDALGEFFTRQAAGVYNGRGAAAWADFGETGDLAANCTPVSKRGITLLHHSKHVVQRDTTGVNTGYPAGLRRNNSTIIVEKYLKINRIIKYDDNSTLGATGTNAYQPIFVFAWASPINQAGIAVASSDLQVTTRDTLYFKAN